MNADGSYASGSWHVMTGREEEFVATWTEFLQLAHDSGPGFRGAKLLRDSAEPNHFVSIAEFDDEASRTTWRSHPDFAEGMKACMALCDDTHASVYEIAAIG